VGKGRDLDPVAEAASLVIDLSPNALINNWTLGSRRVRARTDFALRGRHPLHWSDALRTQKGAVCVLER
jgi:hypothetical protein